MTSCVESNWVTGLETLQRLSEEFTLLNMIYYVEEVLTLNLLDCIHQESEGLHNVEHD